jgi:hypothetical protein
MISSGAATPVSVVKGCMIEVSRERFHGVSGF